MKREPGDLPFIVKRHFLRGLRGGSERVLVRHSIFLEDTMYDLILFPTSKSMSDGSAEEVELSLFCVITYHEGRRNYNDN